MLSLHTARKRRPRPASQPPRIGLAVAGGGPIGFMYELGALRALDEALDGLDLTALDCYVGVSSGAFLAASLANRIDTEQMCRIFLTGDSDEVRFRPETFMRPAFGEYLKRLGTVPGLAADWARELWEAPHRARWANMVAGLGPLLPTGLFDNAAIERFLKEIFTRRGRSNDFRQLRAPLFVVAVDLDSGDPVLFGSEDWDDIPISRAIQASAALPGLYPPVSIRQRQFVDGALRRTMHASVVLDRNVDLMIGLNPLVPFNSKGERKRGRFLAHGGLPAVLSQTFRTLLQSRMQVGLARYAQQYPDIDQWVFEPNADDGELFFTNVFSYSARHRICEIAYRNTMADLRDRGEGLREGLKAHGLRVREEIVGDSGRSILDGLPPMTPATDTTARLRLALADVSKQVASRRAARPPR